MSLIKTKQTHRVAHPVIYWASLHLSIQVLKSINNMLNFSRSMGYHRPLWCKLFKWTKLSAKKYADYIKWNYKFPMACLSFMEFVKLETFNCTQLLYSIKVLETWGRLSLSLAKSKERFLACFLLKFVMNWQSSCWKFLLAIESLNL